MYKSIFKEYIDLPIEEMKSFFVVRTKRHIDLVQKYCDLIIKNSFSLKTNQTAKNYLNYLSTIHDESKYKEPEYEPYLYITWFYRLKDEGKNFKIPDNINTKMNVATNHHVKFNKHHPEYWDPNKNNLNVINRSDRDKPLDNLIDSTKMPDIYILEMCADWAAMSKEKGTNTPQEWANKNINKRWKFSEDQENLIYRILNEIWEK